MVGMYNIFVDPVTGRTRTLDETLIKEMDDVVSNSIFSVLIFPNDQWTNYFDFATDRYKGGLTFFARNSLQVFPFDRNAFTESINKFKVKPSLLAWYPADEIDGSSCNPMRLAEFYDLLTDLDPDHPSFLLWADPHRIRNYDLDRITDIVAIEPYCIFKAEHGGRHIETVYNEVRLAVNSAKNKKPVWTAIQVYGNYHIYRTPTAEELRGMIYSAICAGSRGVLFYAYTMGTLWHLPEHEELLSAVLYESKRIKQFEYILVLPEFSVISDIPEIFAAGRDSGKQKYIIAVNPNDEPHTCSFNINSRETINLFTGKKLTQQKGKVEYYFSPHEAAVFQISQ